MQQQDKNKKVKENAVGPSGERPRGRFWRQCRNAVLITVSFQIFSVCMNPAGINEPLVSPGADQSILTTASEQVASLFVTPALAQIRGLGATSRDYPQKENVPNHLQLAQAGARNPEPASGEVEPEEKQVGANQLPLRVLQEAHRLSKLGDRYYHNQQWKLAAEAYKAAMEKRPDDGVLRHNYELAMTKLRTEERRTGGGREARQNLESEKAEASEALAAEEARKASERQEKEREARQRQDITKVPLHVLKEAKRLSLQGDRYYENKEWKLAAEAYKAALEKRPDDEVLRHNYELAAARLAAAEGRGGSRKRVRQKPEGAKLPAKPLREQGSGPAGQPLGGDGSASGEEPVVPKEKRTQAINMLEKKRNEAKKKRIDLEQKVSKIQKKPQATSEEAANLGKLKQELTNTKNDETYYNFFIKENLNPPAKSKN